MQKKDIFNSYLKGYVTFEELVDEVIKNIEMEIERNVIDYVEGMAVNILGKAMNMIIGHGKSQ